MTDTPKTVLFNYKKLREIYSDSKFSISEKATIIYLLLCHGDDGIFPTHTRIAKHLGYSTRHIITILNSLKEKRIVDWKRRGFNKGNIYTLSSELYFTNVRDDVNTTSAELRNPLHLSTGIALQNNDNNIKENINNDSVVHTKFFELCKRPLTVFDRTKLQTLVKKYGLEFILKTIDETRTRNFKYVRVGLIESIAQELNMSGSPKRRPIYEHCDKCQGGYIPTGAGIVKICQCLTDFETLIKKWKLNPYSN